MFYQYFLKKSKNLGILRRTGAKMVEERQMVSEKWAGKEMNSETLRNSTDLTGMTLENLRRWVDFGAEIMKNQKEGVPGIFHQALRNPTR